MKTIQAGLVFVISDRGLSPASYPGSETVSGVELEVMKVMYIRVT
jgi:hypothetical protein